MFSSFLPPRLWTLCVYTLLACAGIAQAGVNISYTLPYTAGQTKTYRVTLSITDPNNTDWLVSTFLSGAVRTVNDTNQGQFTETWNGLDDNRMPMPPGTYKVKGVYLDATQWSIDGQYHAITPKYVCAPGDSWMPPASQDTATPPIHGYGFSNLEDVQVGANGRAGFAVGYLENASNPFLVDMNQPVGISQIVAKYSSAGIGGGQAVACDGEYTFVSSTWDQPYIYRAHDKNVWGPDSFGWGLLKGYALGTGYTVPSMVAWKRTSDGARFLYLCREETATTTGTVRAYNGEAAAYLGESPAVSDLRAVTLDRQNPGTKLYALYKVGSNWTVGSIPLTNGVPSGSWTTLFTVSGTITAPTDMDMDSTGYFYIAAESANAVYRMNSSGTITYTWGGTAQTAGSYDRAKFMSPRKVTTWKDSSSVEHVLITEMAGPGRTSEWAITGGSTPQREWILVQDACQYGAAVDPADPTKLYAVAGQSPTGGGLVRYSVNYTTGVWTVDAVWPDICKYNGAQPSGVAFPRIINAYGQKYLVFAGSNTSNPGDVYGAGNYQYMIYRQSGSNWIPSAGLYSPDNGTTNYWWRDANGDGVIQSGEYSGNAANLPAKKYWGDVVTDDLSFVVSSNNYYNPYGWQAADSYLRNTPTGTDGYGNPIFSGANWAEKLIDSVLNLRQAGTATRLTGANELDPPCFGVVDVTGSTANGYFIADSGGVFPNPYGIGYEQTNCTQVKLSRYVPDGQGGYTLKWRTGRKAIESAPKPGEMYIANFITGPVNGLVAVIDWEGLCHLYSEDGAFLETIFLDRGAGYTVDNGGMYMQEEAGWMRPQLYAYNGKTYLLWGRTAYNIYELAGDLTPTAVSGLPATVTLTPAATDEVDYYALALRGYYGTAHILKSTPAPSVTLPLDGALTGWDTSAGPVLFQADSTHTASVRLLNDADHLYLRMKLRTGGAFTPQPLGSDPTTLVNGAAGHTTVSLYLRCDTGQASVTPDGSGKDVRLVFAVVDDNGTTRAVCLGMYPTWTLGGTPAPKSYTGDSGTVNFAHVGLMSTVDTGYRLDADGQGLVIAAKIPRATVLPISSLAGMKSWMGFSAAFSGTSKVWWGKAGQPTGCTSLTDNAANARLYPELWGQGLFSEGLTPPYSGSLYSWLKGDAITGKTEGQAISTWTDSSGHSRAFGNGTSSKQPTYNAAGVNGWPGVHFDGVDDQLYYVPGTAYTGGVATFVYGQSLTGQANSQLYDRLFSAVPSAGGTDHDYNNGLAIGAQTTGVFYPTQFAHAPSNTRTLATMGLGQMWTTVGGASTNTAYAFRGDLSEVLVYGATLSQAQQNWVWNYLNAKYTYPPATAPTSTTLPTADRVLWLKADAITGLSDGATVSSWTDSGGSGYTATQATAGLQPIYKANALNGKPAVRFDGLDDYLGNAAYNIPNTGVTYVAAFRTLSADGNGTLLSSVDPVSPTAWAADKALGVKDGNPGFHIYNIYGSPDGQNYTTAPVAVNDNAFHILVAKFDDGGSRIYVDGVLQEMGGVGSSWDSYGNSLIIGASPMYSYLHGDIGELIVYHRSLTNRELDQVKGYLQNKYNGTSPSEPPTCTLTTPAADGAGFLAGNITLAATAADLDGSISKVEFYQGTTKLGEDTSSPYSYTWNASAGNYAITARAYDNASNVTVTPTANITVTSATIPTSGLKVWLNAGQGVTLDNGKVARWNMVNDGLAVTAYADDVAYGPTYSATNGPNAKPVLSFNGSQKLKVNAFTGLDNLTNTTWFVVGKGTSGPLVDFTSGPSDWSSTSLDIRSRNPNDGSGYHVSGGQSWANWANASLGTRTGYTMLSGRYTTSGSITGWKDMGAAVNGTGTAVSSAGTNQQFSVGADVYWTATGDGSLCDVSEILVYNRALSDTEVNTVRNYLNSKYAIDGNQPPTCTLTAPTLATAITAGTNYTITATATDDGSVSKVEFYQGTTKLGEDTSSPYTYTWNNVSAGNYNISAKATDNLGSTRNSDVVTLFVLPSSVKFWQDAGSGVTTSNGKVSAWASRAGSYSFTAAADDPATYGPTVSATGGPNNTPVILFDGTDKLRVNYATALDNSTAGSWFVVGQINAGGGQMMVNDWGPADWSSTTAMMMVRNPNDGTGYHSNAGVGYASWGDVTHGALSGYQLFSGNYTCSTGALNTWIGFGNKTSAVGPTMTNTGTHQQFSLGATGYDATFYGTNCNISEMLYFSSALTDDEVFLVRSYLQAKYFGSTSGNQVPTTVITAPAPSATFSSGGNITIDASACDSDGTISKVEFYQGTTKLGEDTTAPYSYTWNSVATGNYSLTVKATDDDGAVTTSSAVTISVADVPTTGLIAWMDGGQGITLSGSLVTSWASRQGTFTLTPAADDNAYAPTYAATGGPNSKPVLTFNGSQKLRRNFDTALNNATALTWFVVGKRDSGAGPLMDVTSGPADWSSVTFNYRTRFPNDGTGYHVSAGPGYTWSNANVGSPSSYAVFSARWANTGTIHGWLNGNSVVTGTGSSVTNTGTHQQFALGADVYATLVGDGTPCSISEVLLYNRALSDTEVDAVRNYLRSKYNL